MIHTVNDEAYFLHRIHFQGAASPSTEPLQQATSWLYLNPTSPPGSRHTPAICAWRPIGSTQNRAPSTLLEALLVGAPDPQYLFAIPLVHSKQRWRTDVSSTVPQPAEGDSIMPERHHPSGKRPHVHADQLRGVLRSSPSTEREQGLHIFTLSLFDLRNGIRPQRPYPP